MVPNLPAYAGRPGFDPWVKGRSPGGAMAMQSRILVWRIPDREFAEEPGGL